MDKLKYIKLENEDGSYSDSIPLAVDSDHVDVNGDTLTNELSKKASTNLVNTNISNLQNQINSLASGSPLVASSVAGMTNTNRIYVNTSDSNWYYYNGTQWVVGGQYVADNTTNLDVNKLVLNKNFNNEFIPSDINFSIGAISIETGADIAMSNRARNNGFLYNYLINYIRLLNSNYKFRCLYYNNDGSFSNYSDWSTDLIVIPNTAYRFRLVFAKINAEDMTETDLTTIKSSLKYYKLADNLLLNEYNSPINNLIIKNNIDNLQKKLYQTERIITPLSTSNFSNFNVQKYNGYRGATINKKVLSTGRLSVENHGPRIVYNNTKFNLSVFYYTKSESDQNGVWYQGYIDYGTSADFLFLYHNVSLLFTKVDNTDFTSDDIQEVVDSIKYYQATKNNYFEGYKRFEIENNNQNIKGILSLPSSYESLGKPTKIIALLHGGGGAITNSSWYGSDWDSMVSLLNNNGFAVFDVNRLNESFENFGRTYGGRLITENIHLAFKWIREHFNVEDKFYIHGTSMGGATALAYILNYSNEIIACSCFAPVSNLSSINLNNNQDMIAQCFGYTDENEAIEDNYQKLIGYSPALKFIRHNSTTNEFKPYNLESILPIIKDDYSNRFWNKNNEFLLSNLNVPIKIWIGSSDSVIDLPFCRKYIEALRNNGCNAELVEIENQDHHNISFALPTGMRDDWIEFLNRF